MPLNNENLNKFFDNIDLKSVAGISEEDVQTLKKVDTTKLSNVVGQLDNLISNLDNTINLYVEDSVDWLTILLCCQQYYQQLLNVAIKEKQLTDPNFFNQFKRYFNSQVDDFNSILEKFNEWLIDPEQYREQIQGALDFLVTLKSVLSIFLVFKDLKFPKLSTMNIGSIATSIIMAIVGYFSRQILDFVSKNITNTGIQNKFDDFITQIENLIKVFYTCDDTQSLASTVVMRNMSLKLESMKNFLNYMEYGNFFKQLESLVELRDDVDEDITDYEKAIQRVVKQWNELQPDDKNYDQQVRMVSQSISNLCTECTPFIHLFGDLFNKQFTQLQEVANMILDLLQKTYFDMNELFKEVNFFMIIEQLIRIINNLISLLKKPEDILRKLKGLDFKKCYQFFNYTYVDFDVTKLKPSKYKLEDYVSKTFNIEPQKIDPNLIDNIQKGRVMNEIPIQSYINEFIDTGKYPVGETIKPITDLLTDKDIQDLYEQIQKLFDKNQNINDIKDNDVKQMFNNLLAGMITKNEDYFNLLKRLNADLR